MPALCIFGLDFDNNIVIFEVCILKIVLCQRLVKKQKSLASGPKMSDFGILILKFEKFFVIFEISYLEYFYI